MVTLASSDECTGCGACAYRCPKGCISMKENQIGVILPQINNDLCINCHSCEKVCPALNKISDQSPRKAYAAWSLDKEERRTSASGGIAAEMYKIALEHGFKIVGAVQNDDYSVSHQMSDSCDMIRLFKNSKYVFSSAYEIYGQIKKELALQNRILFIGLPCQVAALKSLFNENSNLVLVEVVCHGSTPHSYLKQHIDMLNRQNGCIANRMSFRDPDTYTYTYTFTLYNSENQRVYAKRTKDGDTYQFGYHRSVSYRENCYHCKYAKTERCADITLADFSGLGVDIPFKYDTKNVSLVLINSEKGADFFNQLLANKRIFVEERTILEAINGNAQLRHPFIKNKYRLIFEKEIKSNNGDFEKSIIKPFFAYKNDEKRRNTIGNLKRFTKRVINIIIKK